MKRIFFISIVFFVMISQTVLGQIPQTISYQGVLKNSDGTLVSDGNYSLTVELYDVETAGTALWTETHSTVSVSSGIFNVILGSVTTLNLSFDKQYWLGVAVGTPPGTELTPRIKLASSPYSLNALSVLGTGNTFPSSGNVGIGTTSPDNTLEVVGSIGIRRSVDNAAMWFGSGADVNHVLWNDYHGGPTTRGAAGSGLDGMKWNTNSGLQIRTGSAGATDRLIIDDPSNYVNILNSNVGIGTTSPGAQLHIADGQGTVPTLSNHNLLIQDNDVTTDWAGVSIVGGATGGAKVSFGDESSVSAGEVWYSHSLDNMGFNTAGSERMRILSSGNVGIGTTSPTGPLHVVGGTAASGAGVPITLQGQTAQSGSLANGGDIVLQAGNGDGATGIGGNVKLQMGNAIVGGASVQILDGSGNTKLHVNSFGNVGIGTTSPAVALDVVGNGFRWSSGDHRVELGIPWGETGISINGAGTGSYSRFDIKNNPNATTGNRFFSLFYNADGENNGLVIRKGGKVGIGTASPNSTFETNGSFATSAITTVTAAVYTVYTVTASDYIILVDNSVAIMVALPTAVGIKGRRYIIKKISAGAMIPTIDPYLAETIDGAASYGGLDVYMESIEVISDGSNWLIISKG